jgi:hypothetical protein
MIGHRFEIELNGREHIAWENGAIEVVSWPRGEYQTREIWQRGKPLGHTAKDVIRAMGIEHLVPTAARSAQ